VTVWQDRELDQSTADALAIVTLYTSGGQTDLALAAALADELTAAQGGTARLVGGLVSVAAVLLALREWDTDVPPQESLATLGSIVASALVS
jgi:hypothetical protein